MGKIRLTPAGVSLIEEHVLEEWIDNPEEVERAFETLNLNMNPNIRKYLRDYFDIKEDLMLIRHGMEPKHHFREFYGLR